MIWSLLKATVFFALVALLSLGAVYLLEHGESLRIVIGSTELTVGPLVAVLAALAFVIGVWILLKIAGFLVAVLRFVRGDETAISRFFGRNRQKRGLDALGDALIALAAGDPRRALVRASRAERVLGNSSVTALIEAQAAEALGDPSRAKAAYRALLGDDRTRAVAIRGLLRQKLAEGDEETALRLAEKALELRADDAETLDLLLKLQIEREDWEAARRTLAAKLRAGLLPRDVYRRRDAVLCYAAARDALESGRVDLARKLAAEANRLSPDFVPAAVLEARMLAEEGKKRQARKVLERAWSATPHPDIARAYAALEPDETAAARRKRFRRLLNLCPDDPETRLTEAELAIADEDFVAARKALVDLVETHPTARALTLMAAAERGVGADDTVVRAWLARAVSAPRGRQWICEKCHHPHAHWQVLCESCGGFDTLAWAEAPESGRALPEAEEMLPLLVGTPAEEAPEPEEASASPEAGPEAAAGEAAEEAEEVPPGTDEKAPAEPPETPEAVPVGPEADEASAAVAAPPPADYVREDAAAPGGQKVEK